MPFPVKQFLLQKLTHTFFFYTHNSSTLAIQADTYFSRADAIIKERRSIRKYREEEVSQELLQEVLETALWAPSGMNRQDWELVVVRSKERDRLLEIVSKSQEHILPHVGSTFQRIGDLLDDGPQIC